MFFSFCLLLLSNLKKHSRFLFSAEPNIGLNFCRIWVLNVGNVPILVTFNLKLLTNEDTLRRCVLPDKNGQGHFDEHVLEAVSCKITLNIIFRR